MYAYLLYLRCVCIDKNFFQKSIKRRFLKFNRYAINALAVNCFSLKTFYQHSRFVFYQNNGTCPHATQHPPLKVLITSIVDSRLFIWPSIGRRNERKNCYIGRCFASICTNVSNFHSLEVVCHGSETQLQVGKIKILQFRVKWSYLGQGLFGTHVGLFGTPVFKCQIKTYHS